MESNLREQLEFITKTIRTSAQLYLKESDSVETKENDVGSYDIVTDVDVIIEDYIISEISRKYPNDRIICEERNNDVLTDERTWVLDPIDGTINFHRGIPAYGIQAALLIDKEPVLSVIYIPSEDSVFSAVKGLGAFVNDKPLQPKRVAGSLKESIISLCDFSRKNSAYRDALSDMISLMYNKVARIKMVGAACYDFVMVSTGRVDLHIRFVNNIWDFIPGLFLAEMSGAYIDRKLLDRTGFLIVASNEDICKEFYDEVAEPVISQLFDCKESDL